ncbi:BAR domain-containing protein [Aphelenchoides bicaudatus]|nr:BAR domain-containing protein [Aphelenchoides bicaudatus]
MLKKLTQKFANKAKKVPEYEGPVQKRIVLLNKIKDLAVDLVDDCTELSKTFDQEEGPLKNMSECLAINLKLLADAIRAKDETYATFLLGLAKAYDELGRAQRKFQANIKEKIIDPFSAWILTDYERMDNQILNLHERKYDMDKAKQRLTKSNVKKEDQILAEQTSKEFERQMEIVRSELLKLTAIKNDHALIFYYFLDCYKTYHEASVGIFEGIGANKWATLISNTTQTK